MSVKVGMVSLGCAKNQVDAEMLLSLVVEGGYEICADPGQCQVVIINTCGFIEDAKRESIETILEFCQLKKTAGLQAVVVTGCLAERYKDDIAREIPEADVILGIGKNADIAGAIGEALRGKKVVESAPKTQLSLTGKRVLSGPGYYAYLKVADGCDNCCSYCAIPLIRGGFRSRKIEEIEQEARFLIAQGVKEINLVAQDTTRYGEDLYGRLMLPELIDRLCKLEGLVWLRILYCYPDRVTDELLETMAAQPKVVKYMDIPLQHSEGGILRDMNRSGDRESLLRLLERVRGKIPGVVVRTTMIAGFPGETEEQFEALCDFVGQARFERLGCFAYSQEEDTPAGEMPGLLDEETRRRRAELVMERQMQVAFDFSQSQLGRRLQLLVEGFDPDRGLYGGRSYMDAPDIDTRIYFASKTGHKPGDFVEVEITDAEGYDLVGRLITEDAP